MKKPAHGGRSHKEAVLTALRQGKGEPLGTLDLLEAMYPGEGRGESSVHSLHNVVGRLRDEGHDLRGTAGQGYWLIEYAVARPPPRMRRCLGGCDGPFLSIGPHNRVCDKCRERQRDRDDVEPYSVLRP